MLPPTTYRRLLENRIVSRDTKALQESQNMHSVVTHWIDNYQDKIATTSPHLKQSIYRSTQMTVWASRLWSTDIDFMYRYVRNFVFLCCYPRRCHIGTHRVKSSEIKGFRFGVKIIDAFPKMETILDAKFEAKLLELLSVHQENYLGIRTI